MTESSSTTLITDESELAQRVAAGCAVVVIGTVPAAPLAGFVEALGPGSVAAVTTAARRAALLASCPSLDVRHQSALVASVTDLPSFDALARDEQEDVAGRVFGGVGPLRPLQDDPMATVAALRKGRLFVGAQHANVLLGRLEVAAGGRLEPLATRSSDAGLKRLVFVEAGHHHSDHVQWVRRAVHGGPQVVLVVDPATEHGSELWATFGEASETVDRLVFVPPVPVASAVVAVTAASPANRLRLAASALLGSGDGAELTPCGEGVSLTVVRGLHPEEFGFAVAGGLRAAGATARRDSDPAAPVSFGVTMKGIVLVVMPTVADVGPMWLSLESRLSTPVKILNPREDERAATACAEMLRVIERDDVAAFARVVVRRVRSTDTAARQAAVEALRRIRAVTVREWLVEAAGLVRSLEVTVDADLARLGRALDGPPRTLIRALADLIPITASRRMGDRRTGRAALTPSVEQACHQRTVPSAIEVLERRKRPRRRRVKGAETGPVIYVAAANQVAGVQADHVIVVRPADCGFTASKGRNARYRPVVQEILYGCAAVATRSFHVIHGGVNDIAWWLVGVPDVLVSEVDLHRRRPDD